MLTQDTTTHNNSTPPLTAQEKVREFTLALLQAFLRTGYYQPGHPEARKAKSGIHANFCSLVACSGEITYLLMNEQGRRSVVIEGATEQALQLSDIMYRGMADTYQPRFVQFLERKDLVSLSLNARMSKEELSRFIDVMSEPSYADIQGESAQYKFIKILRLHGIANISFVFSDDVISERKGVPWRTRMALSRLKKDIHLLPVLRNLSGEELHDVKRQILLDILRPLAVPELIYALLLNLDLAASALLTEEDGERDIFTTINDRQLLAVGNIFVKALLRGNSFPPHVTPDKSTRILAALCQRLGSSQDARSPAMLEVLFNKGLISAEQLPAALRRRMALIKRVATYLSNPHRFLDACDSTTEAERYAQRVAIIADFVPLLTECGRINEACDIVALLNRHIQERSSRSVHAVQKRGELVLGSTPVIAAALFLKASKEVRITIGTLFWLLGHGTIPHLQKILIESDDTWRSKQACETLIAMGDPALNCLISSAHSNLFSAVSLPVVLHVLGEHTLGHHRDSAICLMQQQVRHSNPTVTHEALLALAKLRAAGSYDTFSAHLGVPDLKIRKTAVLGLGVCGERKAYNILTKLIERGEKQGGDDNLELAASAIEALGSLMNSCAEAHDAAHAYLAQMAERYCSGFSWKKLVSGGFSQPLPLLFALTETVGRLRNSELGSYLPLLSQHRNSDVARRAREFTHKYRGELRSAA